MKIILLGDIVGRPGRKLVKTMLPMLRERYGADMVLANGENASGGVGLSAKNGRELLNCGLDGMTSGNHIWKFRDMHTMLDKEPRLVRPANYPEGAPGRGWMLLSPAGQDGPRVAVINLLGRTYMDDTDCPFATAERILAEIPEDVRVRIIDFHAEATSEKAALALMLDGSVSVVAGTHTHVQTSDCRVLPGGTAFITDLGMCGPENSCLGMKHEQIIYKFRTALPVRFEVAKTRPVLQGAVFEIDEISGRALSAEAFSLEEGGNPA